MNIVTSLQQNHGIIVKVNAVNGTPLVEEGNVIKEGEKLIGGWLEGKYTDSRFVHANGEVWAKVWYTQTEEIDFEQVKKDNTGNVENKYSVMINNFHINLYKTLSKFKKYDTIEETKNIRLFSNFYIPIKIIKTTNTEYLEKEIKVGEEEAKTIGIENAKRELEKQILNKEQILNTYTNINKTNKSIQVEVIYEVLEEIGTKEKIEF